MDAELGSTVAETRQTITARGGLRVEPEHSFENCPSPDILVVPGGMGTRRDMNNPRMLSWLQENAQRADLILSVCSGALLLGKAVARASSQFSMSELAQSLFRLGLTKFRVPAHFIQTFIGVDRLFVHVEKAERGGLVDHCVDVDAASAFLTGVECMYVVPGRGQRAYAT